MFKKRVLLPFLFLIGCGGCNPTTVETSEEPSPITWEECGYEIGEHPCDFTLEDQNGDDWNLYSNYGSIIILDFSTEWCAYCQVAASEANTFTAMYEDDDVLYITIMIEDRYGTSPPPEDMIDYWVQYFGLTEAVLRGDRNMLDASGENGWPIQAWPTFFIIDREMKLHKKIQGYSSSALMLEIDNMLVEETTQDQQ